MRLAALRSRYLIEIGQCKITLSQQTDRPRRRCFSFVAAFFFSLLLSLFPVISVSPSPSLHLQVWEVQCVMTVHMFGKVKVCVCIGRSRPCELFVRFCHAFRHLRSSSSFEENQSASEHLANIHDGFSIVFLNLVGPE